MLNAVMIIGDNLPCNFYAVSPLTVSEIQDSWETDRTLIKLLGESYNTSCNFLSLFDSSPESLVQEVNGNHQYIRAGAFPDPEKLWGFYIHGVEESPDGDVWSQPAYILSVYTPQVIEYELNRAKCSTLEDALKILKDLPDTVVLHELLTEADIPVISTDKTAQDLRSL